MACQIPVSYTHLDVYKRQAWGFPEDLQRVVLKGEAPITCRPGELLPPVDLEAARKEVEKFYPGASDRTVISWCLYPKVVEEFCRHRQEYGYIMRMGSHVFFNGLALGETNKISIEDGKTPVSYTHLDVYKRQPMRTVCERKLHRIYDHLR